jgi:hypothetical protein
MEERERGHVESVLVTWLENDEGQVGGAGFIKSTILLE